MLTYGVVGVAAQAGDASPVDVDLHAGVDALIFAGEIVRSLDFLFGG
jgi:hypothetical protein